MQTKQDFFESLKCMLLLSFSGGFQDAYTYIARGKVFANAQTGNLVLMSTLLMQNRHVEALTYLFPLLSFGSGVFLAAALERGLKNPSFFVKEMIIFFEIITLFIVGWIPEQAFIIANMLVSFSCAMQVQGFRKLRGNSIASTMIIGNVRSGVSEAAGYFITKDRLHLKNLGYYALIIFSFALGAGIGGNLSILWGIRSIWVSCVVLSLVLLMERFITSGKDMG